MANGTLTLAYASEMLNEQITATGVQNLERYGDVLQGTG